MTPSRILRNLSVLAVTLLIAQQVHAATVDAIYESTGVKGGLVVLVGCGDGKLAAELRPSERYLVHGLDKDGIQIATARAHIQSLGAYGPVAVDRFDGVSLPYVKDSVNLLIIRQAWQLSTEEIVRVLAHARPGE